MGKKVKQTNSWVWKKVFGMTILGWINILILQWLFIRLSYHWVYVDPATDEDARVDTFWDDEKTAICCKNFLLLCHYRVYFTSIGVVGRLCNAVQIQMPFNQSKRIL
jgi:hypothetical protein